MGYGTVLLVLEQEKHMGTGIKVSQELVNNWTQPYPLTYYSKKDNAYAYCETTGSGWKLGEIPKKFESMEARIIE